MLFDHQDVAAGECHSVGQPWTAEEVYAVRNLGIAPELVRKGILKVEDLQNVEIKAPKKEVKVASLEAKEEELVPQKEEVEQVAIEEEKSAEIEQTLEEIQLAYTEIVGKIPVNMKNNKERLKNKILSTKN